MAIQPLSMLDFSEEDSSFILKFLLGVLDPRVFEELTEEEIVRQFLDAQQHRRHHEQHGCTTRPDSENEEEKKEETAPENAPVPVSSTNRSPSGGASMLLPSAAIFPLALPAGKRR